MTATIRRPLTGRRVLTYLLLAFATVVTANMTLLYAALGSFPGLVVRNSYVASQHFDADRAAQERLGWQSSVSYADGAVTLRLRDAAGVPVTLSALEVQIGRPARDSEDRPLELVEGADRWEAAVELAPGRWQIAIRAVGMDGREYRQRRSIYVRPSDGG